MFFHQLRETFLKRLYAYIIVWQIYKQFCKHGIPYRGIFGQKMENTG